jgi:DNA-directed RNA polymerase specialized sigma24 family protein
MAVPTTNLTPTTNFFSMSFDGQASELWIAKLKCGDEAVARQLFRDVYNRLMLVASRHLGPQPLRWVDEEDVALSAFDSFCRRASQEQFPQLANRHDLWRILVKITARKAKDYLRAHRTLKRGGGWVRGESAFAAAAHSATPRLDHAARENETPELIAVVAEECREMLALLDDDAMRSIAVWKLEGYTDQEIAARLGCVERTVIRRVNRIRDLWKRRISR